MFADQALELEGVIGFSGGQKKKTNTHQRCERAQRLCSLCLSLSPWARAAWRPALAERLAAPGGSRWEAGRGLSLCVMPERG